MSSVPEQPTLRIVPIHEADLAEVAALVNRAFSIYSRMFKGQRTSPEDYRAEAGDDARVLLIERDGQLLASGMIARAERFVEVEQLGPAGNVRPEVIPPLDPAHPWSGALYFGLAGVEPQLMNAGLGRMLVSTVERVAREEGFPSVALGTLREFGLVEYYSRLSYEIVHEAEFPVGHWDFVVPHRYCEMVKPV